jgi:hypothetical protein
MKLNKTMRESAEDFISRAPDYACNAFEAREMRRISGTLRQVAVLQYLGLKPLACKTCKTFLEVYTSAALGLLDTDCKGYPLRSVLYEGLHPLDLPTAISLGDTNRVIITYCPCCEMCRCNPKPLGILLQELSNA